MRRGAKVSGAEEEGGLSSIEMTVLGMFWLRGPCTVYAVMRELGSSESTFHRKRAGTAYSVANRLLKAGLLEWDPEPGKRRVARLTREGTERLEAWLAPPTPLRDIAHSADLVRLRFFFLGALCPEDRTRFVDGAVEGLREFESRCRRLMDDNQVIGDYYGVLATAASLLETRARIRWLESVREIVEQPLPNREEWVKEVLVRVCPPEQ